MSFFRISRTLDSKVANSRLHFKSVFFGVFVGAIATWSVLTLRSDQVNPSAATPTPSLNFVIAPDDITSPIDERMPPGSRKDHFNGRPYYIVPLKS